MLRYEYKYFVHNSKMDTLRNMITPFVKLDKHSAVMKDRHYTVRSIYFDTPTYDYYFEKIEGIKHRKKFRIRGYNDLERDSLVFFEIKRKYEIPIFKNRAVTTFEDACNLFRNGRVESYISNSERFPEAVDNVKRFFYHYYNSSLRPVVLVIYEREAYLGLYDQSIRITFDKNLRSVAFPSIDELYLENRVRNTLRDHFILEVKFNDYYPSWMKPIIGILGLRRESASKYCISIDSHNFLNKKKLPSTFAHTRIFSNNFTI